MHELCRLQGCKKKLKWRGVISRNQLGAIAGNAMTVSVMGRILVSLLPAIALTWDLEDPWLTVES